MHRADRRRRPRRGGPAGGLRRAGGPARGVAHHLSRGRRRRPVPAGARLARLPLGGPRRARGRRRRASCPGSRAGPRAGVAALRPRRGLRAAGGGGPGGPGTHDGVAAGPPHRLGRPHLRRDLPRPGARLPAGPGRCGDHDPTAAPGRGLRRCRTAGVGRGRAGERPRRRRRVLAGAARRTGPRAVRPAAGRGPHGRGRDGWTGRPALLPGRRPRGPGAVRAAGHDAVHGGPRLLQRRAEPVRRHRRRRRRHRRGQPRGGRGHRARRQLRQPGRTALAGAVRRHRPVAHRPGRGRRGRRVRPPGLPLRPARRAAEPVGVGTGPFAVRGPAAVPHPEAGRPAAARCHHELAAHRQRHRPAPAGAGGVPHRRRLRRRGHLRRGAPHRGRRVHPAGRPRGTDRGRR